MKTAIYVNYSILNDFIYWLNNTDKTTPPIEWLPHVIGTVPMSSAGWVLLLTTPDNWQTSLDYFGETYFLRNA